MAFSAVSTTNFSGPAAAVAAKGTLQNGWIDLTGNKVSINSSGYAVWAYDSTAGYTSLLARPTAEATADGQISYQFTYSGTGSSSDFVGGALRSNAAAPTPNEYAFAIYGGQLVAYAVVNGSITTTVTIIASGLAGLTPGTDYVLTVSAVQTNGTTTTLAGTVSQTAANGGAQIATGSATDTTSALQNVSGVACAYVFNSTGACKIKSITTFSDVTATATTYKTSVTPGSVGVSSPAVLCVAPTGVAGSAITITPAATGVTFSPASAAFTSGSPASILFTATPSSAGTKSITTTNSSTLTNPSAVTLTAAATTTVPVNSSAFLFSPGNWIGDTGRGGSVSRRSWRNGAWFRFVWTAAASGATATILMSNSGSSTNTLSYFLNGVLTDNVAATGNVSISGIVAGATNILEVYLRNSNNIARWNGGINSVTVTGIALDSGSSAGTAPAARPWVALVGDSNAEGWLSNAGSSDFLTGHTFLITKALDQLGYDTCVNACAGIDWAIAGDQAGDVPAYYYTSGGTYNASLSSWNLIDQGVSLLDSASQISSYGATGTPPTAILINLGTNAILDAGSTTDLGNSIQQGLAALRAAAPSAAIGVIVPFGIYYSAKYSQSYVTAIKAAVAAYQSAHPSDTKTVLLDFGASLSTLLEGNSNYINTDLAHFLAAGHAIIAPMLMAQIESMLNPSSGSGRSYTF